MRFLGTTTRSSNVHALLTSLCAQLRRVYAKDDAVPSDFKELVAYFKRCVFLCACACVCVCVMHVHACVYYACAMCVCVCVFLHWRSSVCPV